MKINPKQIEKAMKKMGMTMDEIEAEEVIIKTHDKDIVISNPQVSKVNAMGQDTWQITGEITERPREEFSDDDIQMVVNQTGVSKEEAMKVLKEAHGDLAESIMKLKKKKETR